MMINNLKITRWYFIIFILCTSYLSPCYSAERPIKFIGIHTCTPQEKWDWGQYASPWIQTFELTVSEKISPIRSFSEAFALRSQATTDQEKIFAEYWISRSFYNAGLIHLSFLGFNALLAQNVQQDLIPFQWAALHCIKIIHQTYPAIELNRSLISKLEQLNASLADIEVRPEKQELQNLIWESAFIFGLQDNFQNQKIMKLLIGSGPYESLAHGLLKSHQYNHKEALSALHSFLKASNHSPFLKTFINQAHLLYARSAYSLADYSSAIEHYRSIGMRSNEWIHALNEVTWAYFMAGRNQEAIGTAMSLQSGSLRNTYSPEAVMVMAMILNEVCRFPEAMNTIKKFKTNYRDSFFWLKNSTHAQDLYKLALDFALKRPASKVPAPIASEWIRTPVFISHQERINLFFKEKEFTSKWSLHSRKEQKTLALSLIEKVKRLRKSLKQNGKSKELLTEVTQFKAELTHYHRLKWATPFWRKITKNNLSKSIPIQKSIIQNVNSELNEINLKMLSQLEEVAENNDLIEVEILNGASEDLIWQNAHPDFREVAKNFKNSDNRPSAEKIWDWGSSQGGLNGQSEVWEDELGSLTADISDDCENKDKYLAIEGGAYAKQ